MPVTKINNNKLFLFAVLVIVIIAFGISIFNDDNNNYIVIDEEAIINGVYGEISYFNITGSSFSFPLQDTYYNFTGGECLLNNSVYCSNSSLEIVENGTYQIVYSATGDGGNNNKYISAITVNDVPVNNSRDIMIISATGDTHKMRGQSLSSLVAGDKINLVIQDYGDTSDGIIYEWNFYICKLGE